MLHTFLTSARSCHDLPTGSLRIDQRLTGSERPPAFTSMETFNTAMTTPTSNASPGTALARLNALGLALPNVPAPRGAFKPFSRSGQLIFLSGQICEWEGEVRFSGPVGEVHDLQAGQQAAQICALNLLAALHLALDGDLDRVLCCHRVGGFVYATPGYPDVPKVINGASDLFFEVFGERGRHARTAVGVATLPAAASVEVEAIFEVR